MAKKKKQRRRQRFTIPLAIVGGMLPVAVGVWNRRSSSTEMGNYLQAGFTGISSGTGTFDFANLRQGLFPIMAGFVVHTVASRLGINRALGRSRLPVVRI